MPFTVRLATAGDAEECLAIYTPIVRNTTTSFELEPPTVEEMRERIVRTMERYLWLVCESTDPVVTGTRRQTGGKSSEKSGTDEGEIVGYAYATSFRPRPAYQWNVETTVYVREDSRGRGVGRALYTALFERLCEQGFRTALAAIALPNAASVAMHERFGFKAVGIFHSSGFKLGRWVDVGWWEKEIQPLAAPPALPTLPLPPRDV